MVRYYGFLSNRKRGELLPKVYAAREMEVKTKPTKPRYDNLRMSIPISACYAGSEWYFECGSRFANRGFASTTPSAARKEAMVICSVGKVCLKFRFMPGREYFLNSRQSLTQFYRCL